MDPITRQAVVAAAGAGGSEGLYVDDVFSTFLYVGNNSTNVINNGIDLSGEGGLVWIKDRENVGDHFWYDTERGVAKYIRSNVPNNQTSTSTYGLQSFNSNGFTLGANYTGENASGYDIASWTFRKAPGFFDVVTYTGNGSSSRTIAHNLGSVPGMILIKMTSAQDSWVVYHRGPGATKYLMLNSTNAAVANTYRFNNTEPTASVFTVGNDAGVNANGYSYVAYIFAHDDQSFGRNGDESIIKCGSYTGNGSGSGPVIDLGFEPQWLLIKRTSNTDPWILFDNIRGMPTGGQDARFEPNNSNAEDVFGGVDLLPTGFQLASSTGFQNQNGQTYIYMAIRRPHKRPTAATEVFAANTRNGNETANTLSTAGFPVDFAIISARNVGHWTPLFDRLRGPLRFIVPQVTNAESSYINSLTGFDNNTAIEIGTDSQNLEVNKNSHTYVDFLFKRAPGFFDVVTYTGTGGARTVNHNLAATPELIIIKRRDSAYNWPVYDAINGPTKYLKLNSTDGSLTGNFIVNNTAPTSTQITVGDGQQSNGNTGTFVAYLFASLSGISKVGSYSGTGSNIDVDCGFTAGARFILIKRTDSSGDWYVWDTARGIVSGNDPYLLLNSTAAEVTSTDYVDPLNAGFTVTSSAPAALNASGGTYLFLAIA